MVRAMQRSTADIHAALQHAHALCPRVAVQYPEATEPEYSSGGQLSRQRVAQAAGPALLQPGRSQGRTRRCQRAGAAEALALSGCSGSLRKRFQLRLQRPQRKTAAALDEGADLPHRLYLVQVDRRRWRSAAI